MKRLFSVFLLLILFLPSAGTTLWFLHRQKEIRKEVKHQLIAGLSDSELIHFKFTQDELASLEWKHDKEFKYNGYMYDIVKRKKLGDTTHFWCWKDDKETELYQEFESLLASLSAPKPIDQQSQLHWVQFNHSLFCNPLIHYDINGLFESESQLQVPYQNFYDAISLQPNAPPPNLG